jgi:hypothetical protein
MPEEVAGIPGKHSQNKQGPPEKTAPAAAEYQSGHDGKIEQLGGGQQKRRRVAKLGLDQGIWEVKGKELKTEKAGYGKSFGKMLNGTDYSIP